MRAALAANQSLAAFQAALEAGGATKGAVEGVTAGVKISTLVGQEMRVVKALATARGLTMPKMGLELWGRGAEANEALQTAAHVAKVKKLGCTRRQIENVRKAYAKVSELSATNPDAGPRAELMQYIVNNW
ncbi:DUF4951 domain-containing protein [Streptomyces sp. SID12488]|uniref:DUF4951 domain-containing protein n=1 Tax=Streptomyces sp. SID12488 TaxID=2706040 RepID=UPI0013DBCF91|nr:DUF4951 domain-containing protein [Streptomyces sp. SID12488]NEA64613.1 hypothetical protein [Streptomyces sp. SID12488]